MSATITDTQGIIAIAAAAGALAALLGCVGLYVALQRLRAAQRVVLGDGSTRDLIAHAAQLELTFQQLRDELGGVVAALDERLGGAESALRGAIAHHSLVRYDAYNEMSGRQSVSIALLDADRSGIVISSIHHRDQARMYAKEVHGGRSELKLSPEEEEAIRLALTGGSSAESATTGEHERVRVRHDGARRRG